MKKIYLYIIIAVIIILVAIFFGARIAGLLGLVVGGGAAVKKKKEKAQKNIEEAGENIEADKHDSDSALDMYDDFFDNSDNESE